MKMLFKVAPKNNLTPKAEKQLNKKIGDNAEQLAASYDLVVPLNDYWKPRETPKGKIRVIRTKLAKIRDKQGEAAVGLALRSLAKRDLFYLCKEILGFKDLVEPLHDDLCDFLSWCENNKKSSLVLIPRGHFKSTIATTGRCIQWILKNQNVTIGLGSATLTSAVKFIKEIREDHFENNTVLRSLFKDIFWKEPKREGAKWTQQQFTVKRTKETREPTMFAFGLEENLPTGPHFRKLIFDDVVDAENVKTPDRMEAVKRQMRYLKPLLVVPSDPMHFVGTRYHQRDAYSDLMARSNIMKYVRKSGYATGKPIFPERFTTELLQEMRVEMGNYIFSCQMEQEPLTPNDRTFKREWLRYAGRLGPKDKENGFRFFLTVDPANTQRKNSDFTAMLVHAVDWKGNMYLVDGAHDKLTPLQRINKVFFFCEKYSITEVGYETIGFQETDSFWLNKEMILRRRHFTIIEIKSHKQSKSARIEGLSPIIEAGKYYLPIGGIPYDRLWESPDDGKGGRVDIVEEWLREYDVWKPEQEVGHDDLLDDTTMARQIVKDGHIPLPKEPPKNNRSAYGKKKEKVYNPMAH